MTTPKRAKLGKATPPVSPPVEPIPLSDQERAALAALHVLRRSGFFA